ncbi:MAG: hypothetical protein AAB403_12265 [Planctomycetota bacterium]
MLRNIYLYGALGRRFGYRHRYDVASLPEAVMALSANKRGFKSYFYSGPAYSFVKGSTRRAGMPMGLDDLSMQLGKNDVHIIPVAYGHGGGSGDGKAVAKIVLGVVMIAAAFFTAGASLSGMAALEGGMLAAEMGGVGAVSAAGAGGLGLGAAVFPGLPILGSFTYGSIAATGAMMSLSGISQMIASTPQASPQAATASFERPDARTSFIYNGPVNTVEQGGPVPILYGRMRIGSTLISASISTDQIEGAQTAGLPDTTARFAFEGGEL